MTSHRPDRLIDLVACDCDPPGDLLAQGTHRASCKYRRALDLIMRVRAVAWDEGCSAGYSGSRGARLDVNPYYAILHGH